MRSDRNIQDPTKRRRQLDAMVRKRWPEWKKDPDALLDSRLFRVLSDCYVGEDGFEHPFGDVDSDKIQFMAPLRMTHFQRRLMATRDFCRANDIPTLVDVVKSRRARASTRILGSFLTRMMVTSGVQAVLFGPTDDRVQTIFKQIVLTLWDNLMVIPETYIRASHRAMDRLSLRADAQLFSLSNSDMYAMSASVTSADAARGMGALQIAMTEAEYIDGLDEVSKVIASAVMRNKLAEFWRESTIKSRDSQFVTDFLFNWRRQGEKNWWEPGFNKRGNWSRLSVFNPAFADLANRQPLYKDEEVEVTPDDLKADFDSYEKQWFPLIVEYHLNELRNFMDVGRTMNEDERKFTANKWAIEYINFRRARLLRFYPNIPVKQLPPYNRIEEYYSEHPHTVDEACSGKRMKTVLGPDIVKWMGVEARTPIFDGQIHEGGRHGFRLLDVTKGEFCSTRVFNWPWKFKGPFGFSLDPHEGRAGDWVSEEFKYDFIWASVFDWDSGEQICEYVSQTMDVLAHRELWTLLKWVASSEGGDLNPERIPYVAEEALEGAPFTKFLLFEKEFPTDRVAMEARQDSVDSGTSMRYGWYPTRVSKPLAIGAMERFLLAGKEHTIANEDQRKRLLRIPKLIPRSKHIAEQAAWFVEKRTDKGAVSFQALHKHKAKPESIDDGIATIYIQAALMEMVSRKLGIFDEPNGSDFETIKGHDENEKNPMLMTDKERMDREIELVARAASDKYGVDFAADDDVEDDVEQF